MAGRAVVEGERRERRLDRPAELARPERTAEVVAARVDVCHRCDLLPDDHPRLRPRPLERVRRRMGDPDAGVMDCEDDASASTERVISWIDGRGGRFAGDRIHRLAQYF